MCIYGGTMCLCVPNMSFLCQAMCPGELFTDDADADNDDDADGRRTLRDYVSPLACDPNGLIISSRLRGKKALLIPNVARW